MSERGTTMDHAQAEELLPWLVNDTLSSGERERVSGHVAGCDECQRTIAELSALQSQIRREPTAPLVPEPDVAAMLDRIDQAERQTPRVWLAAASVVAVLSVALFVFMNAGTERPLVFETATSGTGPATMEYVVALTFESDSPADARASLIESLQGDIIEQTESGMQYRIVVELPAASIAELEDFVLDVESMDYVESAAVVAVQLPVTRD